jgi:hypothetical protein
MSNVGKAEAVVRDLERRRVACIQCGTELAGERDSIALAACTGDVKAAKRLAEIHTALAI